MSVVTGHFTLSAEQKRFKETLEQFPQLSLFWNFEKREYDAKGLGKTLNVMYHGERLMAEFFVAVWTGENTHDFDFIDAAKTLESDHRRVVFDWLSEPYFR